MKKLLILILGLVYMHAKSQIVPHWDWAKDAYGANFDYLGGMKPKICTDVFGNNYVTGYADGDTIITDATTLSSVGNPRQIYIMKHDAAGNLIWAKNFGVNNQDYCYDIISDNSGNIYITGNFSSPTIIFGSFTLINQGTRNMFLVKFDPSGNVIWAKCATNLNSSVTMYATSLALDGLGNIIVSGICSRFSYSFGSYTMVANAGVWQDIYLLKFDSNGNAFMSKAVEAGQSLPPHITCDATGNVYLASSYYSSAITFDSITIPANPSWHIFIIKFDVSGNVLWVKTGGSNNTYAEDICSDALGNIYLTGETSGGTNIFDGVTLINYHPNTINNDILLLKYDTNGNLIIAKRAGGFGQDLGYGICLDRFGNIFLTGSMGFWPNENITFGTNYTFNIPLSLYNSAAFVIKCDTAGSPQWIKYSQGGNGYSNAIAVDSIGNAYIAGTYRYLPIIFGSTTLSDTLSDTLSSYGTMFIAKVGECLAASTYLTQTTCHPYTLNGQTYDSTGVYIQTLARTTGCDSIVTLNLTINYIYGSVNITSCAGYSINGQNYNNSGTYYQVFTDSLGCDSIFKINLTVPRSYSSTTLASCNSYTLNSQTYTSSGTYYQTLTNHFGCDSLITLYLTINSVTPTVVSGTNTLTASPAGATSYQWLDCNNFFSQILGAINSVYQVSTNGDYAVMITQYGCSDTSLCFSVTNIGILENNLDNSITISPNPFTSQTTISFSKPQKNTTIKITDLLGKELKTINFTGKQCVIEKGEMKPGIYFIKIDSSTGSPTGSNGSHQVKKVVIN